MIINSEKSEQKNGKPAKTEDGNPSGTFTVEGHQFINVKVKNSCRPHFGDYYVYEGPVTVLKQVIATPGSQTNLDVDMSSSPKDVHHRGFRLCPILKGSPVILMVLAIVLGLSIWSFYTLISSGFIEEPSDEFLNNSLIYSRASWGAKKPTGLIDKLNLPVPCVMIIEADSSICETLEQCTEMVRGFQEWHFNNLHYPDISVNFMIGGDGRVYEGRGWNKVGQHTLGYNAISIGIMFIGAFSHKDPKPEQVAITQKLIELGVETGKIAKDYRLLGQLQVKSTKSPGARLFESMKSWPHFDGSVHYP